jgi:hypothetical protein
MVRTLKRPRRKKMTTYDYENQRWITGPEAQRLCKRQLRDELELLRSEEGDSYADFIAVDRVEAIKRITLTLTGVSS